MRLGVPPEVSLAASRQEEIAQILATLHGWLAEVPAEDICIAGPNNRTLDELTDQLRAHDIPMLRLSLDESGWCGRALGHLPPAQGS